MIIDRLEKSLVGSVPRLIQDELCRGLTQHGCVISEQIASRLDVHRNTPVNNMSAAMLPTRPSVATPLSALQLLHSGQVNSAFEMVIATFIDLIVQGSRVSCKVLDFF